MRWPRLRSLILLVALLLWFGAVHWYWKHQLPLVPVDVIRFDDGWTTINTFSTHSLGPPECRTLLSNGNLVLAKRVLHQEIAGEKYYGSSGPIRVWDPIHHRVVHDVEDFPDKIYQAWICRRGIAILHSGESVAIVNLLEGKVVLRMRAVESLRIELSPDARLVMLFDHETKRPTAYETSTGRPVFVAEQGSDEVTFEGPNTAVIWQRSRKEPLTLSTQTWKPVKKPTLLSFPKWYSSDGHWAIVWEEEDKDALVDCVNDRQVAVFPEPTELTASQWDFCRQDRELVQIALPGEKVYGWSGPPPTMDFIGDNRLQIVRRATSDGRVLGEATVGASRIVPVSRVCPDGRIFIGFRESAPVALPRFLQEQLEGWGVDWAPASRADYVAIDTATGKVITTITPARNEYAEPIWWESTADFCDQGFTVETSEDLRYFAYPLQRRWLWLFGWALGPAVLLWSIKAAWRYRRRQRPA